MVSTPAIIFSVITLMLSLILPIVLAVWFCRKYQVSAVTVTSWRSHIFDFSAHSSNPPYADF